MASIPATPTCLMAAVDRFVKGAAQIEKCECAFPCFRARKGAPRKGRTRPTCAREASARLRLSARRTRARHHRPCAPPSPPPAALSPVAASGTPGVGKFSYYARVVALEKAFALRGSLPPAQAVAADAFIEALMGACEAEKEAGAFSDEGLRGPDGAELARYAATWLKRAHDEDLGGGVSVKTAAKYSLAAVCFEVLFHAHPEVRAAVNDRGLIFAKGRQKDIMLANKEGRPIPPLPASGAEGDMDFSGASQAGNHGWELSPARAAFRQLRTKQDVGTKSLARLLAGCLVIARKVGLEL
jgi:hypothetical protein